jgi:hypothetical protein
MEQLRPVKAESTLKERTRAAKKVAVPGDMGKKV